MKEEFNLTEKNYHSAEARKRYMGSSMFKEFEKCEVMGLALVNDEIEKESSNALLFGGYVDAYFSNRLDDFIANHPEMFKKDGTLKSDYLQVDNIIKTIENDPVLMKYLNGEKQFIMVGEIAGVPWKIMMDSYHPGKVIVDQKIMKDLDKVWVEKDGMNVKVDFVQAYGYDIQGATYQEIVRQNIGKKIPFVLAVTTKQEYPDKLLMEIEQEYLDAALERVKEKAPRYWDIINGKEEPVGCGHCAACRKKKMLKDEVQSYKRLFRKEGE